MLLFAVARGALAASFLISSQKSKVTAKRVESTGVVQYAATDKKHDGKLIPVTVWGAKRATSYDVCQSIVRDMPLIGKVTAKVTAEQVTTQDSYSDVVQEYDGTITAKNARNGIAAGAADRGPGIRSRENVDPSSWAQDATSTVVTDSKSIVVASGARVTEISGNNMRIYRGVHECF